MYGFTDRKKVDRRARTNSRESHERFQHILQHDVTKVTTIYLPSLKKDFIVLPITLLWILQILGRALFLEK